jgi:N-acetylglutamate synthase
LRTVSEIEAASLATWPALETIEDGQWRARFARGFSGRSNAIWCLDPADDTNAAQRIETLSARYAEHDLPTVFRVTPLTGGGILDTLDRAGWERFKTSLVLSCPLGQTDGFDGAASLYDATDPAFLAAQTALQGFDTKQQETFAAILGALKRPACGSSSPPTMARPAHPCCVSRARASSWSMTSSLRPNCAARVLADA